MKPCLSAVIIIFLLCASCENPFMEEILSRKKDKDKEIVNNEHIHEWGAWAVTLTAACTTDGEEIRHCALDDTHFETRIAQALGHNWQAGANALLLPTCLDEGYGSQVCIRCEEIIPEGVIPALGHDYQNWTEITAPTCVGEGEEEGTCSHDSLHITRRAISALGHDIGEWNIKPATCIATGKRELYCTRDNVLLETEIIAINPNAHDTGEWHIKLAATCEDTGTRELRCTHDQAVLNTETLAALGHKYSWTTITAPTEIDDGQEEGVCVHDNLHTQTRIAYATGTSGLTFALKDDNTYSFSSGFSSSGDVYIPAYYLNTATDEYLPVTSIRESAFNYNTNITSVTISAGITTIGNYAFQSCTNLTNVTIPASVTTIEQYAFWECSSITTITIPAGVTSIGTQAFRYWTSSQTIYIEGYASQTEANAAWGSGWRTGCEAEIKYWNGSSYQ